MIVKIYIDYKFHCHTANPDGIFREIELSSDEMKFFKNKCQTFIEGYCYDDSKGYVQVYPWKPYDELDAAQREYERAKLAQLKNIQNDLNTSYQEGINSI